MNETLMASALVERIQELIRQSGDMPVALIEPMGGAALPIKVEGVIVQDGRIEINPDV